MLRSSRHRFKTALALIFCLLFQQVAMAAYACTMTQMPPIPVVMAEDCEAMAAEQIAHSTELCQKHCSPDPTSASSQVAPTIPALALPPVAYPLMLSQGVGTDAFTTEALFARSDPLPRVRYCRLLI